MTTNDEGTHNVNLVTTKGIVIMTARRTTRKAATADIAVPEDTATVVPEPTTVVVNDTPSKPARKYMSHENCDHARQGEAGKAARQVCRRNHRAWFAAEAEWLAANESASIAV